MIGLIILFLVIAVIAAIFGFGGIVEAATDIAIILFWIFLALFVIALIWRLIAGRRIL